MLPGQLLKHIISVKVHTPGSIINVSDGNTSRFRKYCFDVSGLKTVSNENCLDNAKIKN